MSPAAQLPLTIIADDLTGACDTGALFAARGPVPVTVWPDAALRAPVSVVDTETRALDPADAARRVSAVARSVARTRIFKKIDSTLRGPIGAELDALLRATSAAGALVCPALPSEHRVVVERVLTVGAVPVAETAIAEDPTFPRAAGTSDVVDPPTGERWLIVAGSQHPATRRQVEAAREAGLTVLATPDAPQPDRAGAVTDLAAQARARLDAGPVDVVLVTGGETLVALYHALGAERLDLEGAPRPGLALGRLRAPGREPLTVVTKAGGFGEPDLFVSLVREAVA